MSAILAPDGDMERLTLYLSLAAPDQLDRLAWHYRWSLTQVVEKLGGELAVEAKLRARRLRATARARRRDFRYGRVRPQARTPHPPGEGEAKSRGHPN